MLRTMARSTCIIVILFCAILPVAVYILASRDRGSSTKDESESSNEGVHWVIFNGINGSAWFYGSMLAAYLYGIYCKFTFIYILVIIIKYVSMSFYCYKSLKNMYTSVKENIKKKETELEDIQLQIEIIKTKIMVREAEFMERSAEARSFAKELCAVRARIRGLLAADDLLRRALNLREGELSKVSTEEECKFIVTLMKELKPDYTFPEPVDCKQEERNPEEMQPEENSVYSSLSDPDAKQDCRVKIVKVTNVYRVACLKHYIKQKRLRRATREELLKKKIEDIKKLLENWHKSLSWVLNNKMPYNGIGGIDSQQEAAGDFSKPNLREFSDSETDIKTCGESGYDEYSWNSYGYSYNLQEGSHSVCDEAEVGEGPARTSTSRCSCARERTSSLCILPEETTSQVAIETESEP